MGLDTSHDCWHGPYSYFRTWREDLTRCIGRTVFEDNDRVTEKTVQGIWDIEPDDVIDVLLLHSDCEYCIPHRFCDRLADRLEEIAELQEERLTQRTAQFASGLRRAHCANEDVQFH
jgi:hypothetical protein